MYKVRFGDDKIEEILAQFANDKSEDELEKYSEPLVCPRLLNDIKTDSGYLVAPRSLNQWVEELDQRRRGIYSFT